MALVIGGILALLAIAVAVYPFVRGRFFAEPAGPDSEEGEAVLGDEASLADDELAEIYQAISTLRLERELGNIPEGLYREQLNGYRLRAARALRNRELSAGDDEGWALEEEIRLARAGLYGNDGGRFPCPNCGRPVRADMSECPECGAVISRPFLPPVKEDGAR
jgi:predicted RNA-binding Zn-ribbon protein involved in translation (DUF1610 family)